MTAISQATDRADSDATVRLTRRRMTGLAVHSIVLIIRRVFDADVVASLSTIVGPAALDRRAGCTRLRHRRVSRA
jgi:hypothetical protein